MEEYREKISELSRERLNHLISAYRKTLLNLENRHKEALLVAMLPVAGYIQSEIDKKRIELYSIEQILQERHTSNKKSGN